MNFKVFISFNIDTVALSWSNREREHPAPAARSMPPWCGTPSIIVYLPIREMLMLNLPSRSALRMGKVLKKID
jgi:hypothetical protein